jgi:AbrB family looped-hinge helix DNA binding protein
MRTTIDKAGRIVVPRALRDQIGLAPGPVDVHVVGNAIQIEVPEDEPALVVDAHGFLVIDASGPFDADEDLRSFRLAAQTRSASDG